METSKIQAAARKALMAAAPAYFSWSPTQQEKFRATMDDKAQDRADRLLLQEITGIECSAEHALDIWRDQPDTVINLLNWAKLLTRGIGEDMIFLNESMAENVSLLDFHTLYDYDYQDHLFQEKANKQEFEDYQGRDYYALRFSRWARLLIDSQFYYATLYSLAGYLTDRIDDKANDLINTLIPHHYVEGKEHGKSEKGGTLWNMKIEANGLEKQLEELQHRWHQYLQQRWQELSQEFCQSTSAVFYKDEYQQGERHRHFILNNQAALKRIRWRHFLSDCDAIRADFVAVEQREKHEWTKANEWLQEAHKDILKNFDPKVVKFKKLRKIVIAPGAFDGLLGEDGDE